MNQKIMKNLGELGFSEIEAQIYAYLGKKGPQRAKDIAFTLRISRQRLYLVLKELERKGLINSTLEYPAKFTAEPFTKVLDLFIKSRLTEAQSIENKKLEILSDWRLIPIKENDDTSAKFTILEGRNYIYPKLKQIIEEANTRLLIASDIAYLLKLDQYGIFDTVIKHLSETQTEIRILAGSDGKNIKIAEQMLDKYLNSPNFKNKILRTDLRLMPRMVIGDGEVIFFVNSDRNNVMLHSKETCLWTNSTSIIESFKILFENLWNNTINEERNKSKNTSGVISQGIFKSQQIRSIKEMFESTEFEIFALTSSKGLIRISKEFSKLKLLNQKGVSIRIMAPITGNNFRDALKLSEICQIKHVSLDYLESTILDNKYLFQFRSPYNVLRKQNTGQLVFEKIFQTTDIEYVQKTKNIMEELWRDSIAPSKITLGEMNKQQFPITPPVPSNELTCEKKNSPYQKSLIGVKEKLRKRPQDYVLNKLINAKKGPIHDSLSGVSYSFGSMASSVIHPPERLKIPNMIINAYHWNKQATFGEEDWLLFLFQTNTEKGLIFVPSIIISDNPKSMFIRKKVYEGTPAAENYYIVKNDQVSVELHGTTIFANWSVPLVFSSRNLVLPPGAILIEGYGNIKSVDAHYTFPSGWEVFAESNGLEAFVTYFNPTLKYSGPATDGVMSRDCIITIYPPNHKSKYSQ